MVFDLAEKRFLDDLLANRDAIPSVDQVWRGKAAAAHPSGGQQVRQVCADRAFTIGAGDMDGLP